MQGEHRRNKLQFAKGIGSTSAECFTQRECRGNQIECTLGMIQCMTINLSGEDHFNRKPMNVYAMNERASKFYNFLVPFKQQV